MKCKECTIGLLQAGYEDSEFVTLEGLKRHIKETADSIEYLKDLYARNGLDESAYRIIGYKVWTLPEYCDRRVITNLSRFNFCPECGAKIDWRKLKHEQD